MPNKPHPPRSKPGKKPAPAADANGEDTSYIVFGDGKRKGKTNTAPKEAVADSSKTKKVATENGNEAAAAAAPKKPDTRTLIGGASWTGKLPLNLLAEHCQKQKWEKPDYTMTRSSTPPGFLSTVILRQRNPKTQETAQLPPIALPNDRKELGVRETAVEARHFAAAFALYRVASGKNMHMMMPPQFRDLWKGEFADIKKEMSENGQGWMYEADPFVARIRRDEEKRIAEKRRHDKEARIEAEKKESGGLLGKPKGKGWSRAPKVDMGKKMRSEVERLVRANAVWNPYGVDVSAVQKKSVVEDLVKSGFRKAHVEEALEVCKDREEALEWLLIHVPEDDLPRWSMPENYSAGVSLASGDLKREGRLQRLSTAGFALEVCGEALNACDGNESLAAEWLQNRLLGQSNPNPVDGSGARRSLTDDAKVLTLEESRTVSWSEEQTSLASIFGDRYRENRDRPGYQIDLEVPGYKGPSITLHAQQPRSSYPASPPVLAIESKLPAYIRLSLLKQVLQHATSELLGEQMVFNIIDWLETNVPRVVDNPGKLSSIASAASAFAQESSTASMQRGKQRNQRKAEPLRHTRAGGQKMYEDWQARQEQSAQKRMNQIRQGLPAWNLQDTIARSVKESQVTIISGETGSGKSTQSVQFILDDMIKNGYGEMANIICTQPRRISALGLADRVADERCSRVGGEIGYAIRGESKQKAGLTRITFVTTGVLLRRLQTSGGKQQDVVDALADVSHVVIDEVHERSLDTDFLMVLLRDVLTARKDLKLILMSATLDAVIFERYFGPTCTVSRVEIPGRTHPVQDYYLDDVIRMTGYGGSLAEDMDEQGTEQQSIGAAVRAAGMRINYDLIARTVECIDTELGDQEGGILIFLPGVAEIDRTLRTLSPLSHLHALPLHASLQPAEQRRVFPPAPAGRRKVIAATNVAETSITIEDIVAVIDTGRVKETSFDPVSSMIKLEEVWASRAACKQRRGRAGRVRAGICYKLYTKSAETSKMAERPEPEIRRVPLEQLCLSVKAMGVTDVPAFLASALTPPASLAVDGALSTLSQMGLLDANELTALGRHLSLIPADLRCAKLLVYGATFGCLEACLTIASILTVRSPFISPQAKRDEAQAARAVFSDGSGDLICDLHAYNEWVSQRSQGLSHSGLRHWCDQNFLSQQTLQDISTNRTQYRSSLQDIGFLPTSYRPAEHNSRGPAQAQTQAADTYNAQNANSALLRALIAASFTPQIARIDFPDAKYIASMSGAVAQDPEARTIKYFVPSSSTSSGSSSTTITTTPASVGSAAPGPAPAPAPVTQHVTNDRAFIHPSSTLFSPTNPLPPNTAFVSYFTKLSTSKLFLRDLTPLNAYTALLFGGRLELDVHGGRGLIVGGWLNIRGWARIGVLINRLRGMLDAVLQRKVDDPGVDVGGDEVVGLVRRLVELNGMDR